MHGAQTAESQVHGAAESQWPQVTERLLLAATERLLQREQLAQPRQLAQRDAACAWVSLGSPRSQFNATVCGSIEWAR